MATHSTSYNDRTC